MLTDQSMEQTVRKLERLTETLRDRLFVPVGEILPEGFYETREPLNRIPEVFGPVPERWGGAGVYGWFRMRFDVPRELAGKALYLYPKMGFYEATLWVNGSIHSNYAQKYAAREHGNHWCNRFTAGAAAGERFDFALECYAWHEVPGCHPLENRRLADYTWPAGPAAVCVKDAEVSDFLFDLETLLSLRRSLETESFRRARLENALYEAHTCLYYDPDACTPEQFREGLRAASAKLKPELARHNGDTAPWIGLTGHSHMDTAWLWPMTETEKKCARTYANQLNLMAEYPEYRFIQSSAYHAEWLRRDYPELFSRIQRAVTEGRWEPNGGVWVECDCNLTGGEYMIRQFLWGQRFTRKYYGYTSDCFWLPDTFGYSFAIPQIMRGCGVKYFLTTKMSWNDTNPFPLTTFWWQGLDGSRVLTHFNRTHQGPSPETYREVTAGGDPIREKRVSGLRLLSFGKGDGGGGPEFEMLEMARRLEDLEGTARSGYTSVSDFMKKLEAETVRPTVYAGELYLELHRGTLTNQHEIKHNNRTCERALHDLELALVQTAVADGREAHEEPAAPMTETLLVHQFHDLLPGTCIPAAHAEARESVGKAIRQAETLRRELLSGTGEAPVIYNTLGFERTETLTLEGDYRELAGCETQVYTGLDGKLRTAVHGLTLPAFGSVRAVPGAPLWAEDPFRLEGNTLETPFALIRFDDNGAIASLREKETGRELVGGLPFNTFLMAEDLPAKWDNWDVDADLEDKFRPAGKLIRREVVSRGPAELRIRSEYQLTEKSRIRQDMVFDAHSPMIAFDTEMDWQEDHRFLKAAFDTALHTDTVRCEIQFGCIQRSTRRSTSAEKARFEICNHKYSDLSEANNGIALLNDSKYGISVRDGSLRLSLHKGGLRPDDQGDRGLHRTRYALLPHAGGFSAEAVVLPAYAFNSGTPVIAGGRELPALCRTDCPDVIIETVKPCEDAEKAYILRLYEAMGGYHRVRLTFGHPVKALKECNMLEEELAELQAEEALTFEPFKIRTLKVFY